MTDTPDNDQKTEAPTPKRRADAAREGDILQSREWATALMLLAGAGWIAIAGPWFVGASEQLLKAGLSFSASEIQDFDPVSAFLRQAGHVVLPLASLLAVTLVAAIAAPAALGSLGFRGGAMAFKPGRINPGAGLKRMFGTHGLIELVKALAKAGVLGYLGYWLLSRDLMMIMGLSSSDVVQAIRVAGSSMSVTILCLSVGLLVIAGIDVPVQIFNRNAKLRMTKQQVKEEMRQSDGAPELKQAQRQRQHDILSGSARKVMAEATVVLTNPTHFAVALRYRPGLDAVPLVVARGREEVALAIRELARENSVPTLNYPQLTRALYFTTRAGQPIAEDLYIAVATILAFVFNIERAMAEGVSKPEIYVPDAKHYDENGKRTRPDVKPV
ncbi:MAG: flagellar type III secretion system protein FlhB [Sphingorhabdus sp.]